MQFRDVLAIPVGKIYVRQQVEKDSKVECYRVEWKNPERPDGSGFSNSFSTLPEADAFAMGFLKGLMENPRPKNAWYPGAIPVVYDPPELAKLVP